MGGWVFTVVLFILSASFIWELIAMDRARAMEEAIHSREMEGTYVSAEFKKDAKEYVNGYMSIEELMTRTKRRWSVRKDGSDHA